MAKVIVSLSAQSSLDSRVIAILTKTNSLIQKDKDLPESLGSSLLKVVTSMQAAAKKQFRSAYNADEDDYEDYDVGSHDVTAYTSFYIGEEYIQLSISIDGNFAGKLEIDVDLGGRVSKKLKCTAKKPDAEVVTKALAFLSKNVKVKPAATPPKKQVVPASPKPAAAKPAGRVKKSSTKAQVAPLLSKLSALEAELQELYRTCDDEVMFPSLKSSYEKLRSSVKLLKNI